MLYGTARQLIVRRRLAARPRPFRSQASPTPNVTVAVASHKSGIPESTLYRWLSQPSFKAEFRKQRRMLFERTVGLAQRASTAAIGEVIAIMQHGENEFARLAAAKLILELARETDVEERLEALEELLSEGNEQESKLELRRAS